MENDALTGQRIEKLFPLINSVNEQNSIGNWLEMVGQIILTFNAQETTLSNASSQNNYNKIIDRLNELEKELKSIKDNHS